jgi:hypothetical protein|tara:strand:+ start:86 stop:328 length:243 start_codon:yes stop_codon:yes gene_type:complete
MSFILTLIVCSATSGQCLAPYKVDKFYKDGYDCMVDGYEISKKKTEAIGREEINKQKIYIKFGCYEDHSNKTPASYIIIK